MADIVKIFRKIQKRSKQVESYGTSLAGEHIIIASYEQMTLDKLVGMRFILNKIIKKRKEMIRVNQSKQEEK